MICGLAYLGACDTHMVCHAQAWNELQAEEDPSAVDPLAAATRRVLYSLPQQARTLPRSGLARVVPSSCVSLPAATRRVLYSPPQQARPCPALGMSAMSLLGFLWQLARGASCTRCRSRPSQALWFQRAWPARDIPFPCTLLRTGRPDGRWCLAVTFRSMYPI